MMLDVKEHVEGRRAIERIPQRARDLTPWLAIMGHRP